MAKDNFGLLLAALVGIVAVVGLVVLFNSQSTGAAGHACPDGYWVEVEVSGGMVCVKDHAVVQFPRPVGHSGGFEYGRKYEPGLHTGGYLTT